MAPLSFGGALLQMVTIGHGVVSMKGVHASAAFQQRMKIAGQVAGEVYHVEASWKTVILHGYTKDLHVRRAILLRREHACCGAVRNTSYSQKVGSCHGMAAEQSSGAFRIGSQLGSLMVLLKGCMEGRALGLPHQRAFMVALRLDF